MTKPLLFVLVGVTTSAVSLLGFILTGSSAAAQFRYVFLALYVLATVALFLMTARTMSLYTLIGLGFLTALISVCVEQVLGFCCFPGLVKDLETFGWEHLQKLGVILFGAIAWYTVVALSAYIVVTKVHLGS